jgi:ABC-2 type transport system ATP-binding protein
MNDELLAELEGAQKRFGKISALRGLDLQVRSGELLCMLGPNGAGKSTAISLLLGLLRPDAGRVQLFGRSPRAIEARRQIGVMLQEVALPAELRVRELIALTARYYPEPMGVDEALAVSNTTAIADRPYGKLSGGQKRQAQFAVAICGRPRLIFLDEPTASLDVEARERLWATLRRLVSEGVSMILTTHYLEEAETLSNRVAVLARGQLVAQGSVRDIRALVGPTHIDCVTDMDAGEVGLWPDVADVTRDEQGLHISARNAEAVVRRLLAADEHLTELEVRRAGLAEVFAELTLENAS